MKRSAKPIVALHWDGRPSWEEAPGTGAALPEGPTYRWEAAVGSPHDTRGELWMGDNDLALRALASMRPSSVTLAYMDPPFLTQRVHEKRTFVRRRNASAQPDVDAPSHVAAFDDRWRDRATYLESLAVRLTHIKRVLTDDGSVVVHVDPKTSHYVKVLCDEIFGEDAFASEIVWRYRRWPARTPNFQRVHDVLLRYRKDPKATPCYNQLFEPLSPSTLATWGTKKQRAVIGDDGVRARSSRTADESSGVPMGDVWEIGVIAPVARERTGYPSQKPEALLERLIRALSRPGNTVLDPYAGSGTTLAVAARLGRSFVGMDASPVAEATILPRLDALGLVRRAAPPASSAPTAPHAPPPESQTRAMSTHDAPRAALASAKAPRSIKGMTPNAAQALYPRRKRA